MRNPYEIRGPITYLKVRDANWDIRTVLIDTEDLEKVQAIKGTWTVEKQGNDPSKLVIRTTHEGKVRLLHRLVMGMYGPNTSNSKVIWKSSNRFDLRKSNLGLLEERRIQLYRDAIAAYERRLRQEETWAA